MKSRWFFGLPDAAGNLPSPHTAFAAVSGPINAEYDLVDEADIDLTITEDDGFVVVLNKAGLPVKLRESSDSGTRILMHRGAFSSRRNQ